MLNNDQQFNLIPHDKTCDNCSEPCSDHLCQTCCADIGHEHEPDNSYTCINCGHEGAADIISTQVDIATYRMEDSDA